MIYIPIILGTSRKGRQSEKVARFLYQEVLKKKIKSEIIDVRNFKPEKTDNTGKTDQAKKLAQKITRADALIIVTPEYNHGYPGELKMTLDLLYEEYFYKPVGICGVSAGILGGSRAVEQLRLVMIELHMIPIREALYFPLVQNLFNSKNEITDNTYYEKVNNFTKELISFIKHE